MKLCPNGHNVGDNVIFCSICGAKIKEDGKNTCPQCGNECKENAKFCPQCGTLLEQEQKCSDEDFYEDNGRSKKKIVLMSVIGLFVVLLGVGGWYFLAQGQGEHEIVQNVANEQQDSFQIVANEQQEEVIGYSLEGVSKVILKYDDVGDFHNGRAMVVSNNKYGYIDKRGNEIIPCTFDYDMEATTDHDFHEGLARIERDGKSGFIDVNGNVVIPLVYDGADDFSEGLAWVYSNGKHRVIDKNGKDVFFLTNGMYGGAFNNGYAVVWNGGKYGYVDKEGNFVVPCEYENYIEASNEYQESEIIEPSNFQEGLAYVYKDGHFGYLNEKGDVAIPFQFDEVNDFSEGCAAVSKEGKWGFIDKNGREVVPFQYDWAYNYSEGYAAVCKNGKWGYIDNTGKEVIPIQYDGAGTFSEGIAFVLGNNLYIAIDKNGEEVFTSNYTKEDNIYPFKNGLALVMKWDGGGYLMGFVNTKGEEVIPCIYNGINNFSEGLSLARQDIYYKKGDKVEWERKYGFIDAEGKSTFDFIGVEISNLRQQREEEQRQMESEETRLLHKY